MKNSKITLLLMFVIATVFFNCAKPEKDSLTVYVGTYTTRDDGSGKGIYRYTFDEATAEYTLQGFTTGVTDPSYMTINIETNTLYSINEVTDPETHTGIVSSFHIDPETHDLTPLNEQISIGGHPCFVSLVDGYALVNNYRGGSAILYPLNNDGALQEVSSLMQHKGSGPDADRQSQPHPHSIVPSPDEKYAYVPDLGIDKIMIYKIDKENGKLESANPPYAAVTPGAGPRIITFHPNGKWAYVISELNSTMTAFSYNSNDGSLTEIETVTTLPKDYNGENWCAHVVVHPNGKFLYGSNRVHNSIVIYAINQQTGKLTAIGHEPTGGNWPRHFNITPSGKYLFAANQKTSNITIFSIKKDGKLEPVNNIEIPQPVCVIFL